MCLPQRLEEKQRRERSLALGDHANDLGMFAWAGQSLCPSNADERAKAAATLCSHLSNDEDFIVDALAQAGALY